MYWIDHRLCNGCLACVEACATPGALIVRRGMPVIDVELCTECGACEPACPGKAIITVVEATDALEKPVEPPIAEAPPPAQPAKSSRLSEALGEMGSSLIGGLFSAQRATGGARGGGRMGRGKGGGHRARGGRGRR